MILEKEINHSKKVTVKLISISCKIKIFLPQLAKKIKASTAMICTLYSDWNGCTRENICCKMLVDNDEFLDQIIL